MVENLIRKNIVVGITGGIAAYKMMNVIRELKKACADVRVVLTENGKRFVSILTIEALSENPVYHSLFDLNENHSSAHTSLSKWADCIVIAPATANFISKAVYGLGDDLLSTILLSCDRPVIFAPAMNNKMYENPVVQENIVALRKRGHIIIEPESGELACKDVGIGRLANENKILTTIKEYFAAVQNLKSSMQGKKVLITVGRTEEAIDPVRYISNRSSGRMGFALAEEAKARGAEVTVICGAAQIEPPLGITCVRITSAAEMAYTVKENFTHNDILIMAAAVSDYRPEEVNKSKLKRTPGPIMLKLIPNEDILETIGKMKNSRIVVGFALETESGPSSAMEKFVRKNLDMLIINNPLEPGAEIGGETNKVRIIHPDRSVESLPVMPKRDVARIIFDKIESLINERKQ